MTLKRPLDSNQFLESTGRQARWLPLMEQFVRFWHLAFLGDAYLEEQRTAQVAATQMAATQVAARATPGLTIDQTSPEQQARHCQLLMN